MRENGFTIRKIRALQVLALLVAALLGLELSYRIYLYGRYGRHAESGAGLYLKESELPDARLPARLRPGASVMVKEKRYHIGAEGLRDALREAKPSDHPSVLVLGGSSVFGPENDDASAPPAQTENSLRELLGADVFVLNGAVPGYTTAEARLLAEELLPRFNPEVVVLVEAYNDAKRVAASTIAPMDYGAWRAWSKERWRTPPWWGRSDLLDRLLRRARADWGFVGQEDGAVTKLPDGFAAPYLDEVRALAALCRQSGALFVYGAQPLNLTGSMALATPEARRAVAVHLWPLTPETGVSAVLWLEEAALSLGQEFPVVDLRGDFLGRPGLFTDHVHLSDEGAALWGEQMAKALARNNLVRQALSPLP